METGDEVKIFEEVENHFNLIRETILSGSVLAGKGLKVPDDLGDARQQFITKFLNNHLPTEIEIGHGQIMDSKGIRSKSQDIILYRKNAPKLNIYGSDCNIYLAEGVFATIEIKSTLNENHFNLAMENILSVKKLEKLPPSFSIKRTNASPKIRTYLVAFTGSEIKTIEKYHTTYSSKLHEMYPSFNVKDYSFDFICVLDKGILFKNEGNLKLGDDPKAEIDFVGDEITVKNSLLAFYFTILQHLSEFVFEHYNYSKYISGFRRQ